MSDDAFDDFDSEFTGPAEQRGKNAGRSSGQAWFRISCLNFVEQELLEAQGTEPLIAAEACDIMFVDAEGNIEEPNHAEVQMRADRMVQLGLSADGPDWTPELQDVRAAMDEEFSTHISLARSLGPNADWIAYESAALAEGLIPMKRRNKS
jgi:hypothetical protein